MSSESFDLTPVEVIALDGQDGRVAKELKTHRTTEANLLVSLEEVRKRIEKISQSRRDIIRLIMKTRGIDPGTRVVTERQDSSGRVTIVLSNAT